MLPDRESLTVEFKSEQRRPQSDDEIVDNVVALANTQGGTLYLGIEDNGIVTGVSEQHSNINGLAAFIFNKTVPQQTTRIESFHEHGCQVRGGDVFLDFPTGRRTPLWRSTARSSATGPWTCTSDTSAAPRT